MDIGINVTEVSAQVTCFLRPRYVARNILAQASLNQLKNLIVKNGGTDYDALIVILYFVSCKTVAAITVKQCTVS